MKRVIKSFDHLKDNLQEEILYEYSDGTLERTMFPYKGDICNGVIFKHEDEIYLIPISTFPRNERIEDDDDDNDSDDVDLDTDDYDLEDDD